MYLEEITALQMLEDNDLIINFYEAYDYQERLWIFLEQMIGGDIVSVLETMKGGVNNSNCYSEDFCKYTLYRTLKALIKLH